MTLYDVGPQRRSLLADSATCGLFPPQLLRIIRSETTTTKRPAADNTTTETTAITTSGQGPASFLDAVAQAALLPRLTGPLFGHFRPLFADICARWLLHARRGVRDDTVVASFARLLPLAPYLSVLLDRYLAETDASLLAENASSTLSTDPQPEDLCARLLALWRLVHFDTPAYGCLVPADLQQFFRHRSPPVRLLAIRLFGLVHAAADFKTDALLRQFVHEHDSLAADMDGTEIDYTFLTLHEHARCDEWWKRADAINAEIEAVTRPDDPESTLILPLTPLVAAWGRTVVPRSGLSSSPQSPSSASASSPSALVRTAATVANLEALACRLLQTEPVLLRGPAGAGKTSLVREAARALGMEARLVTLHLNEQTDAKTLLGLYTTGAKPGSFEWRPGILTTAVQEGRWVLIEDLDRAPTDVMSTLLPLIERRALVIASRRETVRAPRSFRLFATVRTAANTNNTTRSLLGERLWQVLPVTPLPADQLEQILRETFPALHALVPDILAVFGRLTGSSSVERPATLRDLLKWCRPDWNTFSGVGRGRAKDERVRLALGLQIAQALRITPAVAEHALLAHEPALRETERQLVVGRATLSKARHAVGVPSSRLFATTAHARRLLEQIAVAVQLHESLLLVGETGIGKTTVIQQLAAQLGRRLVVVNLSQQSEVGDLLGGFKPVSARSLAVPLRDEFDALFAATGISADRNERYLGRIASSVARGRWADVCRLWQQAPRMFDQIVEKLGADTDSADTTDTTNPKRRKTESKRRALLDLRPRWDRFARRLDQFAQQVAGGSGAFAFAFVEGKIVQAVRNGDWLLLDEINLASPDTLESVADLLSTGPADCPTILLAETGAIDRVRAHPDFRVFGAMNPATDVGKRDLPPGLRSRFTELHVASPDRSVQDLVPIVKTYLRANPRATDRVVERVARLYLAIKALALDRRLVDGAGEVPHYSLRTLTRVLRYVDDVAPSYGLDRALYEGFCMGFLTLLCQASEDLVMPLIVQHLFGTGVGADISKNKSAAALNRQRSVLTQPPREPPLHPDGRTYVRFTSTDGARQYWLQQGADALQERADYIRTPYVERNLLNLVRATSTGRFPILIQGPTSAGKTSMIEFLAHFSGNRFVRINNHEHTDLQEYLGSYAAGPDGRLRFQEGVLVRAMRQGHWIVLDELNLAPTDVLEALNRLLDDNRELLVPETQEIVRPHPRFMLFATQNPAGLYGGRKVLSRAFRNRFLELHFDDIPEAELGHILQMRCRATAPSDCERIVTVYRELSRLRQTSRVFEQKNSFATLRDLFRWALREADNRDQIAAHGFMLLAERVRDDDERQAVRRVIETVFRTKIDVDLLYGPAALPSSLATSTSVVWTKAMRRLFVLVSHALRSCEPVLLVGETGCGKTTVCQLLAEAAGRPLHIVNAHQNTETGDLIGSQRPVRNRAAVLASLQANVEEALRVAEDGSAPASHEDTPEDTPSLSSLLQRYHTLPPPVLARLPPDLVARISRDEPRSKALFEWADGSLVQAMQSGAFFLLDEISLADDSVLERLNSVLEPQRRLLLAEKGAAETAAATVDAADGFQFLATMNPGGDFGKKELSPALRNRFTEIWVPALADGDDVHAIVSAVLRPHVRILAPVIVDFAAWFSRSFGPAAAGSAAGSASPFSIRDILVWAQFVNRCDHPEEADTALVHGAATVFIDALGANPSAMVSADPAVAAQQRALCLTHLNHLLADHHARNPQLGSATVTATASQIYAAEPHIETTDSHFSVGSFSIERVTNSPNGLSTSSSLPFAFDAPTTRQNTMRLVRAMQIGHKPILLEGNPGVGKTTLVAALAAACGQPLTRINLSDQTDLMDLFGTDVPVEGAEAGRFAWRDAPFLQAMQRGEWVLLDEMNLASQSVLEGLNGCLDHRGEVYVAELDQTFRRHPDFRLFAAQNPHHQGGGRKGLPASFVNRFLVVYADVFSEADQLLIAHRRFPAVPPQVVRHVTAFVAALERETVLRRSFGLQGSPWEFNLRDTLRWLELASSTATPFAALSSSAPNFLDIAIRQRFRTARDRREVQRLFAAAFDAPHRPHSRYHAVGSATAQIGLALLSRSRLSQPTAAFPGFDPRPRLAELESVLLCVQHNLPCILVGPSGCGKSALLQHVAALAGKPLVVFPLSADVDAMDLVGGFEQADPVRDVYAGLADLKDVLNIFLLEHAADENNNDHDHHAATLMQALGITTTTTPDSEAAHFAHVADCIGRLAPLIDSRSPLAAALEAAHDRLQQPLTLASPRFEWLDSIIVRAAQAGHWLVLDNANLCNASVLDRLNSLLERPQGFLSINEHSQPDGEPRIVALHPDFRIFLTVDPRYGELSRAMRNRSVEIFVDPDTGYSLSRATHIDHIAPVEARLLRFHDLVRHPDPLWLDNLSLDDSALLQRFFHTVNAGRLLREADDQTRSRLLLRIRVALSYLGIAEAAPLRNAILHQYTQFSDSAAHPDALLVYDQPLHPLQNSLLVQSLMSSSSDLGVLPTWLWWLGLCYQTTARVSFALEDLLLHRQKAAGHLSKLGLLNRLQRSSLAAQVAVVARDSTAPVFAFLSETMKELQSCMVASVDLVRTQIATNRGKDVRHLLNVASHIWWQTHALTTQSSFDEARFQAHLGHSRSLLRGFKADMQALQHEVESELLKPANVLLTFVANMLHRLAHDFADGFSLSTGLSMNLLWPLFRPTPIPDEPAFRQVVAMERLAARFDNLKWRVPNASAVDLGHVITSLADAYRLLRVDSTDSAALVQAVTDEITSLESLVATGQVPSVPLFADVFEAVRQLHVLYGNAGQLDDQIKTLVLSDLPTFAQLRLHGSVGPAHQLQAVDYLLSQLSALRPWSGTLSSQLLRKSEHVISSSALASLRSLEKELPLVGRLVTRASASLSADPVAKLNDSLWDLLSAVVSCFDNRTSAQVQSADGTDAASLQTHVRALLDAALAHPQIAHVHISASGLVIGSDNVSVPAEKLIWPNLDKSQLSPILQQHFLPVVLALAASRQSSNVHMRQSLSAVAWVQFSVGCIKLYTPDKVFDPFLEWRTEQDFHATLRASLVDESAALRQFEHDFTAQDSTSLRLSLAEEDIRVLDAALVSRQENQSQLQLDSPTSIYRPSSGGAAAELSRLQKDVFNPVLDVTVKDDISSAHFRILSSLLAATGTETTTTEAQQELQLVQHNVVRLIERLLMSQFTAYQDLAVPVANLLRCLQLGLSLSEAAAMAPTSDSSTPWLGVTPFLGGHPMAIEAVSAPLKKTWEFLLFGGVCASVDGPSELSDAATSSAFSPQGRRCIAECFHYFFTEWNRKLEADRMAEEAKTNLYRFRGSQEDEEEMDEAEFSELFPTYSGNEDSISTNKKTLAKWDLSADVSRIHRDILQPSRPPTDTILDFCKTIARKAAKEIDVDGVPSKQAISNSEFLPATLLAVDDTLRSLQTSVVAASSGKFNFYTDTNLPEARKLVALVHEVEAKFRSLQRVDEIGHLQPLADVVLGCERVLELEFSEPLAKGITMVEKLHEALYEWQFRGYASRQYLTPTLYDRVTATLVSWRKLELSTWSRLFDSESDKCRQDAGVWWFIAYQAAVAGPMSILLGQDENSNSTSNSLAYHVEQLLKELSSYLSSSIMGQFSARLDLLRQIGAHIGLLIQDYPAMAVIQNAVKNLVAFYSRYESKAIESVKKGREGLQKKMNDVLLLASWRDTNIDALRESARKSHLKLFRLVRKFRAVLGQPMLSIIKSGLPDDAEQEIVRGSEELGAVLDSIDIDLSRSQAATKLCADLIPDWGDDAHTRRLAGVDRIVSIMNRASAIPASTLDASDVVSSFVKDLLTSMSELRKETPGLLTEETKDAVKHLKTRKIRLFDETVKAVRQMGFSSNLGTSRLAAQASLPLIFSGSSGLTAMRLPEELDFAGLEYSFHKLVDLAPQFREALYEHHSDLQRITARRTVGYLEGILYVALRQREILTASARSLSALDAQVAHVDSLSASLVDDGKGGNKNVAVETCRSGHARTLRWLVAITQVGVHLAEVHDRLADVDCKSVRTQLAAWASKFDGLRIKLEASLPGLPDGFVSSVTLVLRSQIDEEVARFASELEQRIEERPDLAYILQQIKLWTVADASDEAERAMTAAASDGLPSFTDKALDLSKMLLDAVQKFNKAVTELPTSIEQTAWLVEYNAKLSTAVKSLHVDTVLSSIQKCIDLLRCNYSAPHSTSATALLCVLLPLLQQYTATFRRTLMRLAALHRSTCQLGHRLSRAFVEISSQGFCTPPEKSDDSSGQTNGKLEEGTGLGDGEGAEDISKDIQPDEDLSELAQTANKEQQEKGDGIEDEKDAIDMGNDEMEGEMGSAAGDDEDEDKDGDDNEGEDEEDDMDEEAGDVDDLDPTAVDEKMWDGEDAKDTEKEQQGNESKGQKNDEEQVAAADDKSQSKAADEAAVGEEGGDAEEEKKGEEEDDEKKEGDDGDDVDDDIGSDDEQVGPQQELNRQDQNVEENDALDLPDDMELDDGDDSNDGGGDELDDLADLEEGKEEEGGVDDSAQEEKRGKEEEEGPDAKKEEEDEAIGDETVQTDKMAEDDEAEKDEDKEGDDEQKDGEQATEEDGMDVDEDGDQAEEAPKQPPVNDVQADSKDTAAPSDMQSGVGPEQQEDNAAADQEQADQNENNNSAKRDQGETGQDADEKDTIDGGANGTMTNRDAAQPEEPSSADNANEQQQQQQQPFKKLGDVLERWHRTQREIKQAEDGSQDQEVQDENSADQAAEKEFQHLHDEEAVASTQAMGAADDDEARPVNDAMAIEDEADGGKNEKSEEKQTQQANEESDDGSDVAEDDKMQDDDGDDADDDGAMKTEGDDGQAGASMQRGAYDDVDEDDGASSDGDPDEQDGVDQESESDEEDDGANADEEALLATQLLSSTRLEDDEEGAELMSLDEAMSQWTAFQQSTHGLSVALAAQLRLILSPSQATRLSGGFRTGKRLSIRKIIPYIASGYKRDKIWMRRSVPTKRAYQIMLCVDDSKSMAEAGASASASASALSRVSPGHLALSSLVMVARALAMLEAGQVGVFGFGARVFAAHGLLDAEPFGGSAGGGGAGGGLQGAAALRRFTFRQDRTDVAQLLRTTIDTFRQAREAALGGSASADLWQLALVLSDGLTPSSAHERIRRLLREAAESRIMIVFVVLDGPSGSSASGQPAADSVLDLKEAKFVRDPTTGENRVVIERYLDTFPFPYYLIVHNLDDLPAALAGLLRTWFAEVNS
ncbi:denitrification regulatory protein nirq [Grosmannia clavigera kw1407]|uniref:Midasin n=1 Tax=Grosmannia clavigera (strain kw1407 / UAMH 11150) TaxID=655863 RepID=F0XAN6_GROCL|nr:denitrification regulatory protein nirq [Grosmannia clavigera kw1407]EFX05719.1 denitrification regulatory protein nirq [Grosmannia clavigera kw1407]